VRSSCLGNIASQIGASLNDLVYRIDVFDAQAVKNFGPIVERLRRPGRVTRSRFDFRDANRESLILGKAMTDHFFQRAAVRWIESGDVNSQVRCHAPIMPLLPEADAANERRKVFEHSRFGQFPADRPQLYDLSEPRP